MRYLLTTLLTLSLLLGASVGAQPLPEGPPVLAIPETVISAAPALEAAPVVAPVEAAPVLEGPVSATPATPAAEIGAPPAAAAPAIVVPKTDEEAGMLIGLLLSAAQANHWTVFAGMLILLLVWVFNKFGLAAKIGGKLVPWVTLGISAAIAVAVGLASGAPVGDAIKLGLLEGGVAIALWELVFKHLSAKKADGTLRELPPLSEPEKAEPEA